MIHHHQDGSISIQHPHPHFSLIWLHGRGDKSDRYLPFFQNLHLFNNARIIIPQAPIRNIKVNGQQQPAWYDIRSYDRFSGDETEVFDFDHIQQTTKMVQQYIEKQAQFWQEVAKQNNPYKKIFVAGFSQGAVMSLFYGLDSEHIVGGVGAFGGYMLKSSKYHNLGKLKILLLHGKEDDILIEQECKETYSKLIGDEENVKYVTINDIAHTVNEEEMGIFSAWLRALVDE